MMTVQTAQKADKYIRRYLDVARTKWLGVRFLEGLLRTIAISLSILIVAFLADNAFVLPGGVRLLFLVAVITVFFGGVIWEIYALAKKAPTDEAMARIIEKKFPGSDNQIINSVQLAKLEHSGTAGVIVASLVNSTASMVSGINLKGIVNLKKLRKFALFTLVIAFLFTAYAFGLPDYFNNAFTRLVRPLAFVAPLTDTKLEVEPGNATVGYGRPVIVIANVSGKIPSNAVIEFRARGEGKFVSQEMGFDGRIFKYKFSSVTEDIEYFVEAGDARSQTFQLDAVILPAILKIRITLNYPAFTFIAPRTIESTGSINAPVGTKVRVYVLANVELGRAELRFSDGRSVSIPPEGKEFSTTFTVKKSGWYSVHLSDTEGVENEAPPKYSIAIVPDNLPQIRIIRPDADVTTSPQREVITAYQASDDFGLAWMEAVFRLNAGEERIADRWELKPGTKLSVDQFIWKMSSFGFKPGDKVSWFLRVKDGGSNSPVISRILNFLIVDENELRKRMEDLIEDLQTKLAYLLRIQKEARAISDNIKALLDAGESDSFGEKCSELNSKQEAVRLRCSAIIQELNDPIFETLLIKPMLQRLYTGPMITAMEQIATLLRTAFDEKKKENLNPVILSQEEIIRELEKLLGRLPSILSKLKKGMTAEEIADEFPEKKLQWYKEKLEEFIEEQRKAIEMTRELARIPQEDWTDRERQMQKELEKIQEKWQKFFEEHRDDFSKLPFQDFSDGTQIDEFVEIYQAVTTAYDAIKTHGHDIAVPLEQAGVEKATELVHNIEAWLPDTPDRDKWSMEEPPLEDEIPMAELPEELEDIVGDLIEEEEDMADDIEDISSSWCDSLDEGAGWDCMDGPISNMSAKGKTGNRMPNKSEIGGRSGEGRSGKSSGQFVEKNATGKGGRETPTRLTKDPYESGEVNDTSKDPISGSTGGGKMSGQGGEGLQGPPPPEVQKEMGRLAGQQAQLMSKAENLLHELRKRHYPTREVERAIKDLKEIEKQLREGAHRDLSAKVRSVVQKLRDAQKVIDEQTKINRERRHKMPQRDRDGLSSSDDDEIPPDYKELIEEYYRALAEGDNEDSGKEEKKPE